MSHLNSSLRNLILDMSPSNKMWRMTWTFDQGQRMEVTVRQPRSVPLNVAHGNGVLNRNRWIEKF